MSISALSSNLIADLSQQWQNPFHEIKQDFQQLASALQSGDLSGAQSAYANIEQVLGANSGSSTATTSSSGSSTLQNDFAALGQALQSGDLSTAQSAFSQLQSDVQASRQSSGAQFAAPTQTRAQGNDQYVSSGSQGQNPIEEALQDYTQLAGDLQSGNLTGAQSAYSNLQQLIQAYSGSSTSATSSNTPTAIQTDFATLGQDLQAGSLTQSQSAFSQLQTDLDAPTQPAASTAPTTPDPAVSTTPTQNPVQQVRQDYLQLANALQSGSLTSAQSAFTALEQALQTQSGTGTASTTTATSSNDPIANDLSALGQALSSGNLTQAQSAFTQLNTDIQTAEQSGKSQNSSQGFRAEEHHHHHHGDGGGSSSQSSSTSNSATNSYTSSNSSSTVNVYA
jgi:DNA-binding FadR family transcriptional regulator